MGFPRAASYPINLITHLSLLLPFSVTSPSRAPNLEPEPKPKPKLKLMSLLEMSLTSTSPPHDWRLNMRFYLFAAFLRTCERVATGVVYSWQICAKTFCRSLFLNCLLIGDIVSREKEKGSRIENGSHCRKACIESIAIRRDARPE